MSKTILITGATDGIGLLTAQMLASDGHSVILHGRSDDKLQAAVSQVGGAPATYRADLSVVEEARALAQAVAKDHTQIDVLINNAGVLKAPKTVLDNGQDLRFVVNTLAPYALTMALLPKMPKDGRILNLSSAAQATVNLSALRGGVRLDDMDAYAQSKRAITLWSAHLAQTLAEGPLVFAVNPGSLLASKMVKEGFGVAGHDLRIGADILCRLALKDGFDDRNGAYWDNDAGRFAPVDLSQMEDVVATIEALVKGN
ncbi:MAG: SDR family NAD(P)-dependent oxidoreductase [Pseudomonadota bacterium]